MERDVGVLDGGQAQDVSGADISIDSAAAPDGSPSLFDVADQTDLPVILDDTGDRTATDVLASDALGDRPPPGPFVPRRVAAGGGHSCAAGVDRRLFCWGENDRNQLGLGLGQFAVDQLVAVEVPGSSDVEDVTLGYRHTCAIVRDGAVRCWGADNYGQRGMGGVTEFGPTPDVTTGLALGLSGVTALSAGDDHTCAISGMRVYCWGRNDASQCGSASGSNVVMPTPVAGVTDAVEVKAGSMHTCARTAVGAVLCWGRNVQGQLGVTSPSASAAPLSVRLPEAADEIAVGESFSCARLRGGSVACWGPEGQLGIGSAGGAIRGPTLVPGVENATALSAGPRLVVAIMPVGALAWGWQTYREPALGPAAPPALTNPTRVPALGGALQVAFGRNQLCALYGSGEVRCSGNNDHGQVGNGASTGYARAPVTVNLVAEPRQLAMSTLAVCALGRSNEVTCVQQDGLERPLRQSRMFSEPIDQLTTGDQFRCVRTSAGRVLCWGENNYGQLGDGTLTRRDAPAEVPGLTAVSLLTAGARHVCAYSTNSVYCWGANEQGQVNPSTPDEVVRSPLRVTLTDPVSGLAAELNRTCAWYGTNVTCWGRNGSGEIAFEPTGRRIGPSVATFREEVRLVVEGPGHTCALFQDRSSRCWGVNDQGELGLGRVSRIELPAPVTLAPTADALTAGGGFSCALAGGSVRCWGANNAAQLGDGTGQPRVSGVAVLGLRDVVELRSASRLTCARLADATVRCWGENGLIRLFGPAWVDRFERVLGF